MGCPKETTTVGAELEELGAEIAGMREPEGTERRGGTIGEKVKHHVVEVLERDELGTGGARRGQ